MKSLTLRLLLMMLVSTSLACGSTAPSGQQPASGGDATMDYAGTYKNSGGGTLTIETFVAGKTFDFQLTISSADACNSVNYSGSVAFTKANEAKNDGGDLFKLDGGKVHFEPSTAQIGMDCARVIDVDFEKQK